MRKKYHARLRFSFVALLAMASLMTGACQTLPFQSPEQALRNRVNDMMTARVNQDWGTVYIYLDPDYRKQMPKESFLAIKRDIIFSKVSIESLKIDPSGKSAVVTVKYDMNVMSFDAPDQHETQTWVKSGFKWYYQMAAKPGK